MRPVQQLLRWLLMSMLALASFGVAAAAGATVPRLDLVDKLVDVDAWPAIRMLPEAGQPMGVGQAMAHLPDFRAANGHHANLGLHREAVWLHLPLSVPFWQSGQWVLDIDYPSLDDVAVYVMTDGQIVHEAHLGDHVPYAQRELKGRTHSLTLVLEPGHDHDILMRVSTTSTMILPVRLVKPQAVSERESGIALLQGVAAGIGLCLVMYALAQWLSLRDPAFLGYALMVGSITLFFLSYHGVGTQHLWGGNLWLSRNGPPFFVLPAIAGGLIFVHQTLKVRQMSPRLSRVVRALAWLALALTGAFALGWLDYRSAHLAGTVLGPVPLLLCLPVAWVRMRQGDRAAQLVVVGWGIYAMGVLTMAALLRGWLDLNAYTAHAFQAGALLEMLTWLQVLGVRQEQLRASARRAQQESEDLHSLAHTDALTGLPNRRGMLLELQRRLQPLSGQPDLAVYLIDLDGFKVVNDRLGHEAGDALLCAVATRLRQTLRSGDVVARLGGDEFVLLVNDMAQADNARVVGQKLIEAFRLPFVLDGHPCSIGLTIGFALAPQDGTDPAALLRLADTAMYAGKRAGKNTVQHARAAEEDFALASEAAE
jgi:diguanylate cyclase (GGDEF)-like protein